MHLRQAFGRFVPESGEVRKAFRTKSIREFEKGFRRRRFHQKNTDCSSAQHGSRRNAHPISLPVLRTPLNTQVGRRHEIQQGEGGEWGDPLVCPVLHGSTPALQAVQDSFHFGSRIWCFCCAVTIFRVLVRRRQCAPQRMEHRSGWCSSSGVPVDEVAHQRSSVFEVTSEGPPRFTSHPSARGQSPCTVTRRGHVSPQGSSDEIRGGSSGRDGPHFHAFARGIEESKGPVSGPPSGGSHCIIERIY